MSVHLPAYDVEHPEKLSCVFLVGNCLLILASVKFKICVYNGMLVCVRLIILQQQTKIWWEAGGHIPLCPPSFPHFQLYQVPTPACCAGLSIITHLLAHAQPAVALFLLNLNATSETSVLSLPVSQPLIFELLQKVRRSGRGEKVSVKGHQNKLGVRAQSIAVEAFGILAVHAAMVVSHLVGTDASRAVMVVTRM